MTTFSMQAPGIHILSRVRWRVVDDGGRDVLAPLVRTILVIDDQFGIRMLLQEVLEREGYRVYAAGNGGEALALVRAHRPDLVLLDMKIPGMDGLEILTAMRKIVPEQRVVMMTAYGELDLVREAAALGALGHFTKPFDIDELRRYIVRVLGADSDAG